MRQINWDDLRVVLALSRGNSLSAAARLLRVNESTVGRRLNQIEERLGAMLFDRSQGKLALTEAGATINWHAERIEMEVMAASNIVAGANNAMTGTVRVTSVPLLINRILAPAIPTLLDPHPLLKIELVAEPRSLSLTKREADIALRLARPNKEVRALARKVVDLPYAVFCSNDVDATTARWVSYEDRMLDLPQSAWMAEQVRHQSGSEPQLFVNDAEALIFAIQNGAGKTVLPIAIGDGVPGIRRCRDTPCDLSREVWLLVHPDLRHTERVRMTIDWIVGTLGRLVGRQ